MSIGLRVESGLGIGYFRDKQVVTPLDCRTVFLVKSQEQLNRTMALLQNSLEEKDICAAVF